MKEFGLINRMASQPLLDCATDAPVWQTCLRQMAFMAPGQALPALGPEDTAYEDAQALAFLIRVLCGLDSPVKGETEVLGQFKDYLAALPAASHPLLSPESPWHQFVLAEVKALRDQHISRLGSQSYGSLIRKELRGLEDVAVLGSGRLAADILPWLKDKAQVELWCRDARKAEPLAALVPGLKARSLAQAGEGIPGLALVVAAAIPDTELAPLLRQRFQLIIDCRSEGPLHEPGGLQGKAERLVDLKNLLKALHRETADRAAHLRQIEALIQEHVAAHMARPRYRPQGWEDLCA
jgi:glutamyl-tRNA reductase